MPDALEHETVLNRIAFAIKDVGDDVDIDLVSLIETHSGGTVRNRERLPDTRSARAVRAWIRHCKYEMGRRHAGG